VEDVRRALCRFEDEAAVARTDVEADLSSTAMDRGELARRHLPGGFSGHDTHAPLLPIPAGMRNSDRDRAGI
jgi:hypothetical protein